MSEEVKCGGCQGTHPSRGHLDRCFLCQRELCFRCCRVRTATTTGRTVRVCRSCTAVPDDRLR
jgi:hypothetical protein